MEWTKVIIILEECHGVDPNSSKKAYNKLAGAVARCQELLDTPHTDHQWQFYLDAKKSLDKAAGMRLEPLAEEALFDLHKPKIVSVVEQADEATYTSPAIDKLRELLALPEIEFVALQMEKAGEMKDPVRRINRAIKMQMLEIER